MPDVVTTRIGGDDELIAAFQQAPALADKLVRQAMRQALGYLQGDLQPYPPQPPRDRAKTFNTYVRGIGRFPKSAFVGGQRKKRGAYKPGPRGGAVRRTSEQLGKRWFRRTIRLGGGWRGIYGNTASYAEYVQGEKQPYYHLQTGWHTIWGAEKRQRPRIVALFRRVAMQIVAAVRRIAGGT